MDLVLIDGGDDVTQNSSWLLRVEKKKPIQHIKNLFMGFIFCSVIFYNRLLSQHLHRATLIETAVYQLIAAAVKVQVLTSV